MTTGVIPQKNILIYCLLVIGATCVNSGCKFFLAPGKEKCEKIVSREVMTNILMDVVLLEGWLGENDMLSPVQHDSIVYYYTGLFRKHQITYLQFVDALYCYMLHDLEMQTIHDDILERLSILESEAMMTGSPQVSSGVSGKPLVFIDAGEQADSIERLKLLNWRRYAVPDPSPEEEQLSEEFFK